MAHATTVVNAGPHHIAYNIVEDGNAVATALQRDILGDLTTAGAGAGNPLFDTLNNGGVAVANQAAAIALVAQNVTISSITTVSSAADASTFTYIPNISGGSAGNFRLDMQACKANNADEASHFCVVTFRHSIGR